VSDVSQPWSYVLTSLSYKADTNGITQTLLIPALADDTIYSVEMIGVASDGSGMTSYLYYVVPVPGKTYYYIGIFPSSSKSLLKPINETDTDRVSANGNQWMDDFLSCDLHAHASRVMSCSLFEPVTYHFSQGGSTGATTYTLTTESVHTFHLVVDPTTS
jgi:hypothetical protein